jgi:hypothetical protein
VLLLARAMVDMFLLAQEQARAIQLDTSIKDNRGLDWQQQQQRQREGGRKLWHEELCLSAEQQRASGKWSEGRHAMDLATVLDALVPP